LSKFNLKYLLFYHIKKLYGKRILLICVLRKKKITTNLIN